MICKICPRNCGADRAKTLGRCGARQEAEVAHYGLHFYEEPCISGTRGSGTVFFRHCPLGCVYCQNAAISDCEPRHEDAVTADRLADIMIELAGQGAHNINLVTPTHYTEEIENAVRLARGKGLNIPTVWNTGGYEKSETVRRLVETADIFLTDFKYLGTETAAAYSDAPDYFKWADGALRQMVSQAPLRFSEDGLLTGGVIVRHLMLPGHFAESRKIIEYLYGTFGDNIIISIMNQYTPMPQVRERKPEIYKKVSKRQYDALIAFSTGLGIKNAYIQSGGTAKQSFIPERIRPAINEEN